jgi:uncharacterized protein YdiU (UPF0061 family)
MIKFDNTYATLAPKFFRRVMPTPVTAPRLIRFNEELAAELGLDAEAWGSPDSAQIWSGNRVPAEAEPLAMAYAAHQFGQFVPQLGDGRAILLGEIIDRQGRRRDIQLKGAGPTPFSRSGDGRAALGPVLREYIVSEAMHALGIPTTRALAAVVTGEPVYRETVMPGAVLTRIAASHIRIGTFQFFAARGDTEGLKELADYVIDRHYPAVKSAENPYLALLDEVIGRQAGLVAQWMGVGFIHGVMNTDNMSVSGETIDFGPCAFMDDYDPHKVFSSIDRNGRYAYQNQPAIAQWNLARFAETLLPLIDPDTDNAIAQATRSLEGFAGRYEEAWLAVMRRKTGLLTSREEDAALFKWLLDLMHAGKADFTLTFRRLTLAASDEAGDAAIASLFENPADVADWVDAWRERQALEPQSKQERVDLMAQANPAYIPRNHRIEEAIQAALAGDFQPFEMLNAILARPFEEQPGHAAWQKPPEPDERVLKTFCGT